MLANPLNNKTTTSFLTKFVNKIKKILGLKVKSGTNNKTETNQQSIKPIQTNPLEKPEQKQTIEVKQNKNIPTVQRPELNPGKVQDERIFELEEIYDNPILVEEFFKAYPNIDINSVDKDGRTIYLRAVKNGNGRLINKLIDFHRKEKYGQIDWNATDKNGNNALMIDLKRSRKDKNDSYMVYIIDGWTNPDYINPKTKMTVLQEAILRNNESFVYRLLSKCPYRKDWPDVNLSHPDIEPPLFMAMKHNTSSYLLEKIFDKGVNLDTTYKDQTIYDYINWGNCKIESDKVYRILTRHLLEKNLQKTKEYYEQEGELNLQQLLSYVEQPGFYEIRNNPINDIGETVGHFIAEIHPKDFAEIKAISNIIDKLQQQDYDFFCKDMLKRCPAEKAIEADNLVVLKLLLRVMPQGYYDDYLGKSVGAKKWENLKEKINEAKIDDKEILNIIEEKINQSYYHY